MRNIILLTYDSLRADHCGHHGYERNTTPNIDRLAEDGVAFENAVSIASRTNPSMAGTFTGEPMLFRELVSNPDNSRQHLAQYGTLAEQLNEMGYSTGAFCPNAYASRYYGFDRGFDHFEDFLFSEDTYQTIFENHLNKSGIYGTLRNIRNFLLREEVFRTWDRYIDKIETWVEKQQKPYFLWIFSLGTHFPFLTPRKDREFSNLFEQYFYNWKCNQILDKENPEISERGWQGIIDIYDDSVRFADRLVPELKDRLSGDDPVIIVHSDHGEAFGEHGMFGHYYPSLYEENVHVPMVAWSSQSNSKSISEPFSLLDLPKYITEGATQGKLHDPPTQKVATLSTFDSRRGKNLLAIRGEQSKYILSSSTDGSNGEFIELKSRSGREGQEVESIDKSELFKKLCIRREQHEKEQLAIQEVSKSVSGLK